MKNNIEKLRMAIILKYGIIYDDVARALAGKTDIRFDRAGFRHLLKRRGGFRNRKDMRHRVSLIPLIPTILEKCGSPSEIRGQKEWHGGRLRHVQYFVYKTQIEDRNICMITKKIDDGDVHFLSLHEIT